MFKNSSILLCLWLASTLVVACRKESAPENPFSSVNNEVSDEIPDEPLDPNSLAGLHQNVFKPTCANSGCHDGTFEPDFRTIESTYNTLVNHPIIKNDEQNTYNVRVLPGNADASLLMARLTYDIDGNSGVMPLVVDPDSDWNSNKAAYLENIKTWINAGAK